MARARRKPEHQDNVRAMFCEKVREVVVENGVAGWENAADPFSHGESRTTNAGEMLNQSSRRIKGRAGERTETGDQNRERPARCTHRVCLFLVLQVVRGPQRRRFLPPPASATAFPRPRRARCSAAYSGSPGRSAAAR